ncbi:MAG: hypothetical protein P8Y78_12815 [Acidihalobacter sp.]
MKVHLLHPDRDFDLEATLPPLAAETRQDLELDTVCEAMADGDDFILQVARQALLSSGGNDVETVLYRQRVLEDCLNAPEVVRELYAGVLEALDTERQSMRLWAFGHSPASLLYRGVRLMEMLLERLTAFRALAERNAECFESAGLRRFCDMLRRELDDDYLATIAEQLETLQFKHGMLIGARLGDANKGSDYALKQAPAPAGWLERLLPGKGFDEFSFRIDARDQAGHNALSELRDRGVKTLADTVSQAGEHVLGFFRQLRAELAFYIGALNLGDKLRECGGAMCRPKPFAPSSQRHTATALYDPCLTLSSGKTAVANDLQADGKALLVITGANRGGKSTFLRALGIAQLMLQAGLFVPAQAFSAALCPAMFTHYKREEDAGMDSGKFDEELSRMNVIVDSLVPDSLLLLNESFAATNEKEGSEIASQVCGALLERRIRVLFVTHLYSFAHDMYTLELAQALFLRAERREDGGRSYRIRPAAPLNTSYGRDIYERVFAERHGAVDIESRIA